MVYWHVPVGTIHRYHAAPGHTMTLQNVTCVRVSGSLWIGQTSSEERTEFPPCLSAAPPPSQWAVRKWKIMAGRCPGFSQPSCILIARKWAGRGVCTISEGAGDSIRQEACLHHKSWYGNSVLSQGPKNSQFLQGTKHDVQETSNH